MYVSPLLKAYFTDEKIMDPNDTERGTTVLLESDPKKVAAALLAL